VREPFATVRRGAPSGGYDRMADVQPGVVLFDLDGTLTESGPGIMNSLAYALDAIGRPPLPAAELRRFVGPPLYDSFRDVAGLDEAATHDAMIAYRRYFVARGMYENSVYPGIVDLLRALGDAGRRLGVATSKPIPYALPIVEHFELRPYFEVVCGPALDGVGAVKAEVVADALASLAVSASPDVVLVGDRSHDVVGAHENGIACIGVLWGYGTRDELTAAGADAIAADVDELATLLGLTHEGQATGGDDAFA
jgi:phosphoglycolate phosphatase